MKLSTRQFLVQQDALAADYTRALRSGLSRREALLFGLRASAIAGVAGSALLADARHGAIAATTPSAKGEITLTYSHIVGPELQFDRLTAAEYMKANPQIKDIIFDVFAYDEGFQKQSLALSRGDASMDLLTMDEPWVPSHANAGFLHEAKQSFASITAADYDWDDFHPAGLAAAEWKNATFGVPLYANTLGLLYRKDLYEQAGLSVPTPQSTWGDFEVALKALHKPSQHQYGFASVHQRGDLNVTDWMTYAQSWLPFPDNQLFDLSTWQPRFTEPFIRESLDLYVGLMEKYAIPGSLGAGWDQFLAQYQQGQIGHLIFWSTWWGLMEDPKISKVVGKNGWSTPYAGEHGFAASHRGFWVLGISRTSAHPEEAWKFAEYMTSTQIMRRGALRGLIYGRSSLYGDAAISAKFPYYGQQKQNLDAIFKQHAYRPRLPQFAQLNEVLDVNLAAASAREITTQQASDRMAKQTDKLLKRWGYLRG